MGTLIAVSAGLLERTMTQAEAHAGAGHFRTGTADSVHFTVRALGRYRQSVDAEAVRRYAGALRRAARDVGPITLDLVGLTLAPGSVTNTAELVRFHYEDGPAPAPDSKMGSPVSRADLSWCAP